jgi:hypothetical protein
MENNSTTGWVKLYHPSRAQITIPLVMGEVLTEATAQAIMASLNNLLMTGFTVDMPGVEEGENAEEIGWVLRKTQKNDRGSAPRIEAYPVNPGLVKKLLHFYLNTEEDVAAFEQACGIELAGLPVYVGKDSVERGADPDTDQYIVRLPRPVRLVWKDNPAYDPNETDPTKKKPKRLFVRWFMPPLVAGPNQSSAHGEVVMTLTQAREVICPVGGVKGTKLGVIFDQGNVTPLSYLAEKYEAVDQEGKKVKQAAALLVAQFPRAA